MPGLIFLEGFFSVPRDLPTGAIVAIADVVDVRRFDRAGHATLFDAEDALANDPLAFGPVC